MMKDYQLSAEQVKSFLEDGYLVVPELFNSEETSMLLAAANADRLMKEYAIDTNDRAQARAAK